MIRRELKFTDGSAKWLLISQVEHARISGLLAEHWAAHNLAPQPPARSEVIQAVARHDDGWAAWEELPGIDPQSGRPYTFMNEMPPEQTLDIWDRSIASTRAVGPLAGWTVAGHFYQLLTNGTINQQGQATQWLEKTAANRTMWLDEWRQTDPANTLDIAQRALRLLQACDYLSLWLCCHAPLFEDEAIGDTAPFKLPNQDTAPVTFVAKRTTSGSDSESASTGPWHVVANPWPFDESELTLTAEAWTAPIRAYADSRELLEARRPVKLRWHLQKTAGNAGR